MNAEDKIIIEGLQAEVTILKFKLMKLQEVLRSFSRIITVVLGDDYEKENKEETQPE